MTAAARLAATAALALLTAAAGLGRLRRSVLATQTPALTKDTAELGQQV